jgi:broad specificity phosphatase PhoE
VIYLIRHGETEFNRLKRLQSATDNPLNERGLNQARAAAKLLADVDVACVVSSPLLRARQTAEMIAEAKNCRLSTDERLRELSLGEWEGWNEDELLKKEPVEFPRWTENYHLVAPPGGESVLEGIARVAPLLEELIEKTEASNVAVVGHQGINLCIKLCVTGRRDRAACREFMMRNDQIDVIDGLCRRIVRSAYSQG